MRKTDARIMLLVMKSSIRHECLNGACKSYLKTTCRNRSASPNNASVFVHFCLKKKTFTLDVKTKHFMKREKLFHRI